MRNYKRTLPGLAVAGVIYGMSAPVADAADVNIDTGTDHIIGRDGSNPAPDTVISNDTDVIYITGAQYASSPTGAAGLTINTDDSGDAGETGSLRVDLTVNAEINGTLNAAEGQQSTAKGLVISADDGNAFQGDIILNSSITGEDAGFISEDEIIGDISISDGVTISAVDTDDSAAAEALSLDAVTGNILNAGTITTDDADGIAVTLGAVTGEFTNEGTISADNAIAFKGDATFVNTATVSGDISVADSTTVIIENSNSIVGRFLKNTSGVINLTNKDGGSIVSSAVEAASVTNNSDSSVILHKESDGAATANLSTGTLVNEGTISFSSGTTASLSASGAVTNETGAQITLSGTLAADAITNAGAITVTGASTLTGAVDNTGSFETASLNMAGNNFSNGNNGSASVGVLTSTGAVTNAGTLALSEGSTAASYDGSGGTLQVTVTSDNAAAALLTTTGASTFDGSSVIKVAAADNVLSQTGVIKDDANIIASGTSMPYTGDDIVVTTGSVLLQVSDVQRSASGITADIEVFQAGDVIGQAGFSDSSQSLANFLQSSDPADQAEFAAITSAYGGLDANSSSMDELAGFIDNVRPDDSGSSAHTASDAVTGAQSAIADRGVYTRSGINTGGMTAAGSFWMQALLGRSKQDSREGSLSYKGEMVGYTIGIDGNRGNNTTGLAFTYGSSDVNFERDQKDKTKSYIGSVYNIWQRGNWYVDSSLSFGRSRHEGRRMKDAAALSSEYDSEQVGGQVLAGTYMPRGNMVFEPMLGLRMNHVNVDEYTAGNSDGSLTETVSKTRYKKAEAGLGAAFSTVTKLGDTHYQPRIAFMYYRDFVGDKVDQQVNFAGQDYTIQGAGAEKNTYEVKVGMNAWNESNMEINLGYTRVMQKDFSSDNFKFKFKYNF